MGALPTAMGERVSGMRVLLVTQSYHPVHGGIGEHVRHLGLTLRRWGHEVRVLTSGPPPVGGELPGLDVVRIGRRFRVPSNGSRAAIAWHPRYRGAVRRVVRDRPDVIHIHSPLEPFLPWAVLTEAEVPCVGTFHNAGPAPWGYRFFGSVLDRFARRLSIRMAVSRSASAYAARHFPGDYRIIPNGVDLERFMPNGRVPLQGGLTLLFVGSLEPRKGLDVLVDGVRIAGERMGCPPKLIAVGDGSMRGRFLQRASAAGIRLDWRGAVEPDSLPGCYQAADLLVAPALYGESFGIVLLEALAAGLPVVASRIDGFAEVLDGCPCARLFSPGDAGALAERIVEMARERTAAADARLHATRYSWERVAAVIESAYREAIAARSSPRRLVLK
jgi:phosphatidyl-myo-inositol alpha-mannosyltransferase